MIDSIDPAKDVDGLNPINAGRLATGLPALTPCTPLGCVILTKTVHASLAGMNAIIIGRSNLVGRPLVQLLLNENATVTIAHSRTRDLADICKRADLVFAAVGKPELVTRKLAQAGRDRDRRGYQSRCWTGRDEPSCWGCGLCRSAERRVRDHAGARRGRADDSRVPAGQYVARGPAPFTDCLHQTCDLILSLRRGDLF